MTQHKHHETLRAMADGAKWPDDFERYNDPFWREAILCDERVLVEGRGEFRRKPVPKPDIVRPRLLSIDAFFNVFVSYKHGLNNIEFTFTADGVLKDARVLK